MEERIETSREILVLAGKEVGLETLKFLISAGAPVSYVIIANETDREIAAIAHQNGIPAEYHNENTQREHIERGDRYHWLVNLWSHHILSPEFLGLAGHRLNVHPSLVPHCRGNDNAAWTIRRNAPAGVSLIEMTEAIDDAGIYVQKEVDYPFPVRGKWLHEKLQREAVDLFKSHWPDIYEGKILPEAQSDGGSYHTRKDTEADRIKPAEEKMTIGETVRWALSHDFYPGTTAEVLMDGRKYRITLNISEKE